MNIELKPIAESKVRQLGGDVCGVLVRNEAGAWAAVSEGGRVMWLDDFEGQPSSAQGGRGADAVKWSDPAVDPIVSKLYRKFKEWNRQGFGADDVTWCEVRGYVAELLNTQPQPAVPEEYRQALQDAYDIIVCDANSPKNYGSLCRIGHVLGQITTPTTPQADGWAEPDLMWDSDSPEESCAESAYELADNCASDLPANETMVVNVACAKILPSRTMKIWIDDNDELQWEWTSQQALAGQEGSGDE